MGLFSKLFKKEKISTNTNFITTGKVFIYKPNEDFYHENKNEIKTYERVYLAKLNQNKTLTSLDLKLEDDKYLHHYINKLTKINLEIDFILDPINQSDKKEHTYLSILEEKQKLYHALIVNHINNLFLKKAALENILKRNPFMSLNKKNTIKNLISQIEIQIISMQNAITGNLLEITTLKDRIASLDLPKEENEVTLKRYEKIIEGFDISLNEITPVSIAKATIQIEDEIYNDSHLANSISEDLTKLLSSNLRPKETLTKLDKLIAKCIGIEELGYQKIDNLKEKLFKAKFNILCNLAISNDYNGISFDSFFKEEQASLETILLNLINVISKDPSKEIYNAYDKAAKQNASEMNSVIYNDLIKILKEIITDKNGDFSAKDIFNKPFKLALLARISEPNQLISYFNNHLVKSSELFNYISKNDYIEYTENLPLSSFLKILSNELLFKEPNDLDKFTTLNKDEKEEDIIKLGFEKISKNQKLRSLIKLYELLYRIIRISGTYRQMPEGVKNIRTSDKISSANIFYLYTKLYSCIKTYPDTPTLCCPKSLESIDISLYRLPGFLSYSYDFIKSQLTIQLQEGTKKFISLSNKYSMPVQLSLVQLPSTITEISGFQANMEFNNYLNCDALSSKEKFMKLFDGIPWHDFIKYSCNIEFKHHLPIFDFTMYAIELEELTGYDKETGTKLKDKIYKLFNSKLEEVYKRLSELANILELPLDLNSKTSEFSIEDIKNLYNKIIKSASNLTNEIITLSNNLDNTNETKDNKLKLLKKAEALNELGLMSSNTFKAVTKNVIISILKNYERGTQIINELSISVVNTTLKENILNAMGEELSSASKNYLDEASQESLIETGLITKKIDPNAVKKIKSKINIIFLKSSLSPKTKVEVIYSPILLELLSALIKPTPIANFIKSLNTITISKKAYRVLLGNIADSYYFCNKVPVLTVLKLLNEVPKKDLKPFEGETILNLLDLYNELKAYLPVDEEEIIPPGIKDFIFNNSCKYLYNYSAKLFNKSKTKSIKFFPGLDYFNALKNENSFDNGNPFERISKITLTDDVGFISLSKPRTGNSIFKTTIVIPPNIKSHDIIAPGNNISLEFIDYQNSEILNSPHILSCIAHSFLNEFSAQSEIVLKQEGAEPVVITRQDIEAKAKFNSDKKYQQQILIEEIKKHLNKSNTKSASL